MKKYVALISVLIMLAIFLTACGETISGMGKDVKRIGKGTKTIFIRED